jgi:hypothetical protein
LQVERGNQEEMLGEGGSKGDKKAWFEREGKLEADKDL